ncbi:MAG: hypothetical protein A3G93_06540 [Nitrospinae bacterium RIFCSPLOWO2_12_FULL_45_22]|nr:MAG: hypothetical protein A3G93_06540 [Nitrospinae bacterium RIFCSPLOWO2_12_FULL_45_22]
MGLDKNMPLPKRPRLSSFNYRGTYTYFLTLLTKDRRPLFTNPEIVNILLDFTKEVSEKEGFDIEAYCFMPDHLHLLLSGRNTKSDLARFVNLFKQKSGYWFKQKYQGPI